MSSVNTFEVLSCWHGTIHKNSYGP